VVIIILLEGPDGGGKTTLAKKLSVDLSLPMHKRASDSITGPVVDLYAWTVDDITTWHKQELALYDRHPLTSEHIYGPSVRGRVRPGFEMTNPDIAYMRRYLRKHALIIVCLPPLGVVRENVASEIEQMPGVVENIDHIYQCYRMMLHLWPLDCHIARYDYTAGENDVTAYQSILAAGLHHKHTWRGPQYVR
jgi:hypothetical protein